MYNFIVNKGSGKKRGEEFLRKITNFCDEQHIEYTVYSTNAKGHAEILTRELCEKGADNIIAIGGDGTFHEVLNGLTTPEKTVLGLIPAGRGNDFARASNLPLKPVEVFQEILKGETKSIDYIQVSDRRCLNIVGTGMDVDVLEAVMNKKNAISYYTSLVRCLLHFKPYKVVVKTNGMTIEKNCIMVGAGNGIAFGGGILLCPKAKINDGKLDLVIAEKLDRGLFSVLPSFIKGKHEKLPELTHYDVTEFEVDNFGEKVELDGEIYKNLPFKCKVVPNGIKIFKTSFENDNHDVSTTALSDEEIYENESYKNAKD